MCQSSEFYADVFVNFKARQKYFAHILHVHFHSEQRKISNAF